MQENFIHNLTTPCYAVIFSSLLKGVDGAAYDAMARRMAALAAQAPGYLGMHSARGADGFGITVSYWESEEAIANWKAHAAHQAAQQAGANDWYAHYELRIGRVERAYSGPEGRAVRNKDKQISN